MLLRSISNDEDMSSRNWVFGRGYSSYKSGQYAVEQDIKSALLEFENDCYFALNSGIDWFTRLGYTGQKELLDDDVMNTILNRTDVLNVENFESNVDYRNYTATCDVYTIYSETPINFTYSRGV